PGVPLAIRACPTRRSSDLAAAARGVVTVLRDDAVQEVIEQVLVRKLMERPVGPPLGKVLQGVLADGAHHRMVDLICDRAYDWVRSEEHTSELQSRENLVCR